MAPTENEQMKLLQEYKLNIEKIKTENMNLKLEIEKLKKAKRDDEEVF
jgi:regulator of replication initiation timing